MAEQMNSQQPADERNQAAEWWLLAFGVMFVAAVGAVWIIVDRPDGSAAPGPTGSTNAATTANPTASASPSNGTTRCQAGSTSTQIPVTAPEADWRLVNGIALPFSSTRGPTDVTGPVAYCYEHSPTGALFAAAQIAMRIGLSGREQVLREQVTPGPSRDQLLAAPPPVLNAPFPQWVAFKVVAADGDRMTAQLVQRLISDGQEVLVVHTLHLAWTDGDWKLDLDPPGGRINPVRITSASGYIPWGGA